MKGDLRDPPYGPGTESTNGGDHGNNVEGLQKAMAYGPPSHDSEANFGGNGHNFHYGDAKKEDMASPNYLDANWASSLLLDPNQDLLGNFDFNGVPAANAGSIMQKIQFQNNVHGTRSDTGLTNPEITTAEMMPPRPASTMSSFEHIKKQRRPCDHCRRRKQKCVIIPGTNNCVQCESKSLTCTYLLSTKKDDDDDRANKKARKMDNTLPVQNGYSGGPMNSEIVPPNVQIRDVAPVQDYSMMNNSLLKKTLSLQFPRSSFYVGPTSYLFDTNILELIISSQSKNNPQKAAGFSKIEQVNLSDTISLRKAGERTQFILKDDQSTQSYQNMSNDVDAIEKFVAPHGQILIDLYFRIIHPSYPILHKKVFLEKYSRTHREFSAPLLAAVYVLAIQWWDYDPQLNRFPKPNVELILKIALNNYLLEILKRPKLSAVQAGLLLLQCKHILRELGNSSPGKSPNAVSSASASLSSSFNDSDYNEWVLCSQVIALSEELGLGLDCDNWKLPKWERGLRKRLAWAVHMEDKWLSLKNARPSHINEANWIVLNLVEEDFPEKHGDGDLKEGSSDITNGKKNFMSLIGLSQILSNILNSLYSMRAMRDVVDINDVLRIAKPIQLQLRTWYHSLPIELQMNSVQPRKLCSNGYLQLAYFATELTLHRRIITTMYQLAQDGNPLPKELVNVCRSAAKTRLLASIEFVRDLKPEHIHSFWHSSSSANFTLIGTFAALLFVSSPAKDEADFYKDQIFNYRWILKMSSKGFIQVGDALQKLDLVLNHIPGLLNDSVDQPMVVPNVPTIDYSKLYQQQMQQKEQSQPQQQPQQQTQQQTQIQSQPPLGRYNSYGLGNQQFMNNSGRPSPTLYGPNNGKIKEMTRPSSAQQYRMNQAAQSPYGSPQTFHTPTFTAAPNSISRSTHIGMNSPQSSQGMSPKEVARRTAGPAVKSTVSDNSERRGSSASFASHVSAEMPSRDNHSSKANSPVMTRSPLAHAQQPMHNAGNS